MDVFSLKDVIAVCRIFPRRKLLLKATFVTFFRVLLVFITVALFDRGVTFNAIATCLIACIIAMDGLDGYIARKYGETSRQGAVFDILGDRIVENVLWIYFACIGEFPFWIPVTVITRDVVVDNIRSLALSHGKTAFGETTMQRGMWAKFLVSSNWSRGLYAAAKGVCFTYIGLLITLESANASGPWSDYLVPIKCILVYTTVVFCILRGLPVVWEGREYLFSNVK
ncbi:MAG: hypothetical protein A3C38_03295 [Planctomycetes bacterium RIFCSPHIGHO2_02_FULL_50_42]|nr:MAG: hypothetical protein A2060_06445 [Planctomycetes bacterium GWA2_50_13]OHB89172.1 MAG: hypothetical protein A3C38_03295 [Planctomycetes bacterium RIFCSPHIGHO2_02_FULL_50_42]OHB96444.1 MAG: hypothetical protein A3I59_07310 [Planctomycetes bacterium RIFCSPLOWO2_02_FULL_50_16]OHC02909.1 MAG: hypothetical protein A3G17_06155 [Planctomycetes bacterium RIFCSPLOWO2_12_FULL_50_35]